MKLRLSLFAISAVLGGLLLSAPMKAVAQTDPSDQVIPSLELDQADVRDALKMLFRTVNLNYTIASDVQGQVTVSLRNVPFETALRNILNQVDATYRREGGVYNIIRREAETVPVTTDQGATFQASEQKPIRRIRINKADPELIRLLLSGDASAFNSSPESSTLISGSTGGGNGGFGGSGGGGNGGFGGGGGNSGFGGGGGSGGLGGGGGRGGGGMGGR